MSLNLPVEVYGEVLEPADFWLAAAVAVPRATFTNPVLLTQGDISGNISLSIYEPQSATAIYSTTFAKTLSQDGGVTQAIHPALVDSRWGGLDAIGHNMVFKFRAADIGAGILKGGRTYTAVFQIPTALDGTIPVVAHAKIRPLHI